MRTIKLIRPNEKFNRNISYTVFDSKGKKIDTLPNDASTELNISDDITFIQVKVGWCGTGKIQVPKTSNTLQCIISGNRFLNRYLIYSGPAIALIGFFFNLGGVTKPISLVLAFLIISFVIFSLTFWKNKWLNYTWVNI